MGNASSVQEVDYTRKKGKVVPEKKVPPIPKEKHLTPAQLAVVFPYLEEQAARLGARVEQLNKAGGWEAEYGGITDGDGSPAEASLDPNNAELNRYRNIVAYDHTRVRVAPNAHNRKNDYINANWMPGYKQNRGYIASQGPVPESIPAFWQMVWMSGSTCIVMVTNEIEGNKLKCHRYWPSRDSPTETYGGVQVTLVEETVKSTFIHRLFELKCDGGKANCDHFQYTVWPDHGVPNSTAEIISFRKEVRKLHPHPAPPIVVHCSAGVGRTGTFITIDNIMNRAEHLDKDLDIKNAVRELRSCRNFMVQTIVQYQFAFKTILDGLEKAVARTVRAVQNKSDEIAQVAANIEELELEIGEAMDEYGGEEFAPQLEELSRQVSSKGRRVQPDVRWSAFNAAQDKAVAEKVPTTVRKDALDTATQSWKDKVPSAAEKGYDAKHRVGLVGRVDALSQAAGPDAWKARYAEVAGSWVAEVYDVSASLNPLESRMMSLAQQQNNWRLRGEAYRRQIEEDTNAIVADLNARLGSLGATLRYSEQRWRSKGDGFRGERVDPAAEGLTVHTAPFQGGLMDRLLVLVKETKPEAWKARGINEGREVENPAAIRAAEQAAKDAEEKERQAKIAAMEAERLEKERIERKKREEEARVKADKANPAAKADTSVVDRPVRQMVKLRSPTKSNEEVHPMLAGLDEVMPPQKGPKKKK